jgi:hypothetical protein
MKKDFLETISNVNAFWLYHKNDLRSFYDILQSERIIINIWVSSIQDRLDRIS